MEEDFPRGHGSVTEDKYDHHSTETDKNGPIQKHSLKTKQRKKKMKDVIAGLEESSAKDDLLVDPDADDDDGPSKKLKVDDDDDNGSDELFKKPKKTKSKVKGSKQKKVEEDSDSDDDDDEFVVDPLTYDSICVGFLSLGIVHEIKDHEIVVSLPGRIVGCIPITAVSKPYAKLLAKLSKDEDASAEDINLIKPLSQMFSLGQVIIVKVISIVEQDTGKRTIILTTDPTHINSNYNATIITDEMNFIGAIQSFEEYGYVIDLGIKGVRAFLPKNRISSHKYSELCIGQLIKTKVVKSVIHKLNCTITLTANFNPVVVEEDSLNSALLLPGMLVEANIMQAHKTGLKVYFLELMGTIHSDHTSNPWELPTQLEKYSSISALILYIHPMIGSLPALTMKKELIPHKILKSGFYSKGRSYTVTIDRFEKRGLIVKFQNGQKGIVSTRRCFHQQQQTKDPNNEASILKSFPIGSKSLCRVLEWSGIDEIYIGSFAMAHAAEHRSIEELQVGSLIKCTIIEWKKSGALTSFDGLLAFIPTLHFDKYSDKFTRMKYPPRSQLKVKILKINIDEGKILLTARKKLIQSQCEPLDSMLKVKPGMIADGIIFKAGPKGIHVVIIGGLMGFIPASFLSVPPLYIEKQYIIGEVVTIRVVEVEPERPTLIFSLDLENPEVEPIIVDNNLVLPEEATAEKSDKKKTKPKSKSPEVKLTKQERKKLKKEKKKNKNKEKKTMAVDLKESTNSQDSGIDSTESTDEMKSEETAINIDRPLLKRKLVSSELKPMSFSFWSVDQDSVKNEESDDDNDDKGNENDIGESTSKKMKKSKATKENLAKIKEAEIREKETALADPTRLPESIDDYELLVMASPCSSMCWIKYISLHLEAGNLEEARKIGVRALSVIPFNEEQERFNVWTAMLNLENDYGTEETLKKTFESTLRNCDALETYKKMASIYVASKKNNEADHIFKIMTKKFPDVEAVWSMAAVFYYRTNNLNEGRSLYKRAIARMDKRHHVGLISKFAQLELNFGDFEQGRSLYEKLVTTYPTRVDLWIVYVNQLIKKKDFYGVRNLFDRVLNSGINPKKIHPILKRFLEFEREVGTPESISHVETSCTDYFTAKLGFNNDKGIDGSGNDGDD